MDKATIEEMEGIFTEAVAKLSKGYQSGTLEKIRSDFPGAVQRMEAAQDRVNQYWRAAQKGEEVFDKFVDAVKNYTAVFNKALGVARFAMQSKKVSGPAVEVRPDG